MIVGLGLDLVDLARVRRLIDSKGERALRRLFLPNESAYAMSRPDPYRHLAARIAAKEATYKALAGSDAARGIGWRQIEVVPHADGRPTLVLHERALERAAELAVSRILLSISHSETTAGAVVMLDNDG